jgi:hypothetical protein
MRTAKYVAFTNNSGEGFVLCFIEFFKIAELE